MGFNRIINLATYDKILNRKRRLFWTYLVLISVVLIISRRPDIIFNPQFWAEDAFTWYAEAYNDGAWETLFRTYAGYFAVIHRLVAALSLSIPFKYVPLFFNMISIFFMLIPVLIINSRRFRSVIPSSLLALVVTFLYLGIQNNTEIYGNLANIQWPLAISAFCILFLDRANTKKEVLLDNSVLLAAGVSGPAVIFLVPIAVFLWLKDRSKQSALKLITLLGVSFFQIIGLLLLSHHQRIGSQPDANFLDFTKIVVGQVYAGGIIGVDHFEIVYGGRLLLYALLILGTMIILYCTWRGPVWLKMLCYFGVVMFFSSLVSLRPTPGLNVWDALTRPMAGQRYWFVPIITWISCLIWMACAATNRPAKVISSSLILTLLLIGIPSGWGIEPLPDKQFSQAVRDLDSASPGTRIRFIVNPSHYVELIKRK